MVPNLGTVGCRVSANAAPRVASARRRLAGPDRSPIRLHPPEPLVALVLPIPATPIRQKVHLGKIFHHLVPELHCGIDADRRSMLGTERLTVHPVGQDGLPMEGTPSV